VNEFFQLIQELSGGKLTEAQAKLLASAIPAQWYTYNAGMGDTVNHKSKLFEDLKAAFPGYHWRPILTRHSEYTHWAVSIYEVDPREHYVPRGGVCIHCNKTAQELGIEEQDD
jgi:hypothetical protein